MKRVRQTLEEILDSLTPVEASWLDEHAEQVIQALRSIPDDQEVFVSRIEEILDRDFEVGFTLVRLFIDLSKDEFVIRLKEKFHGSGGCGISRYRRDKAHYIQCLIELGLLDKMNASIRQPTHWSDVLVERLEGGRGSAIKGQQRGRSMEDFVEEILHKVFTEDQIASRCRFTGAKGHSTEKTDFAIPNSLDPEILIEVKAYGATGSKQTDVLGDISRIVDEKRNDTVFILFTDGITWKERSNDLRKLVQLQNEGKIQKIYTKSMAAEFEGDLRLLKSEFDL